MTRAILSFALASLHVVRFLQLAAGHSDYQKRTNTAEIRIDAGPTVASEHHATTKSITIEKIQHGTPEREAVSRYLNPERPDGHGHSSASVVDLIGSSYIAHVTVGTQTVPLLIDTGSSDLWVAPSSFTCLDKDGQAIDQTRCNFPGFVADGFSGGAVPGEYFSSLYANGQYAFGPYGLESVTMGGITVPNQQISLLAEGYIEVSSGDFAGIMGLGYPGMVAGRKGDKPKHQVGNDDPMIVYDTWFANAVKQNLTKPMFSMALDMDGGGQLAIGGVVDVPIQGGFAATPILILNLINDTRADTDFTYYTIIADDYLINNKSWSTYEARTGAARVFPVVIDSGFTTTPLPPSLVALFYDAFTTAQPQRVEIEGQPMFAAPCNTTEIPTFAIQIGGQVFEMGTDTALVARLNATLEGTAWCALGVQPGIEEAGALGDTFLSGVVAVFDVGASEMRFARRGLEGAGVGMWPDPVVSQGRDEL